MSTYIDFDYYANVFNGSVMDEETFNRLNARASDMIDILTGQRLVTLGFSSLSEFAQTQVKKAVAAQVEYLFNNGGIDFIADGGNLSSVQVGSFSLGSKSRSGDDASGGSLISPLISGYLALTGLLYSGVGICI